jgi:hypothetical protein
MSNGSELRIDYTSKDYASLREAMLEVARERLPEWTDHSPNDLGVLMVELFAYMGDVLLHHQDRIAGESYLPTALERRSAVHLLRLIGYHLRPPRPSSADLTLLFDPDEPGPVTIPKGAMFEARPNGQTDSVTFRYERENLTVDPQSLPVYRTPEGDELRKLEPLPVIQVDGVVAGEVVGSSDGSASQRMRLARTPLIDGTLELRVDDGAGPRLWERKETLLYSLATDRHYEVVRDENDDAWIQFGDGRNGRPPERGRNNVTADYRIGGGSKGNVPERSITKAVTSIDGLEEVFNARAASGGQNAEAVPEAAARAPRLFRTMGRAVTAGDFEALALQFGAGKARARGAGWNRVELFVAPAGGGFPSDTLKEQLRGEFRSKRMMTTIVDVRDPRYVKVWIEATLYVEAYFFSDQVRQQAENAVRSLLDFDRVRFADRLYLSKVYEAIEAIEGVRAVSVDRFSTAAGRLEALPSGGILSFGYDEIPVAGHPQGIVFTQVVGGQNG